ncbi:hypothetical protein B0J13DRAFT_629221 [Dactylonectria estremocensis]|uniref:Uncharacterized protein n=1 Tax=Dactylonectria estremocensis TaxID=1079267 RepID=A0A9P9DJD7_9HYPO|nr:hypothetical protein B0J13DRAFT_629221 [Dactylonectria estremocensis]
MISRRSTGSSVCSVSSTSSSVAEHVLRKAYKDPSKLRQGLDQLWGQGQYTLKLRNNRYIIAGPWLLNEDELSQLEQSAYQHYDGF